MSDAPLEPFFGGYRPGEDDIIIAGYRLICTCGACPEQYDVYDEATRQQVGYLRLRHGFFRADLDECGGDTVYEADTDGDGIFEEHERMSQLSAAVAALKTAIAARTAS